MAESLHEINNNLLVWKLNGARNFVNKLFRKFFPGICLMLMWKCSILNAKNKFCELGFHFLYNEESGKIVSLNIVCYLVWIFIEYITFFNLVSHLYYLTIRNFMVIPVIVSFRNQVSMYVLKHIAIVTTISCTKQMRFVLNIKLRLSQISIHITKY